MLAPPSVRHTTRARPTPPPADPVFSALSATLAAVSRPCASGVPPPVGSCASLRCASVMDFDGGSNTCEWDGIV